MLGLLGVTGAGLALAPALRALTYPLFALTVLLLGWGWRRRWMQRHAGGLARRSAIILVLSTVAAAALWTYRLGWID
ncbi:MAG: hypothetical protein IIA41_15470 [SAR324 cluster bacterium]|nr:hypothetical protein [SAR324 cluster bacterium]